MQFEFFFLVWSLKEVSVDYFDAQINFFTCRSPCLPFFLLIFSWQTHMTKRENDSNYKSHHLALTYNILNPELVCLWIVWTVEINPDMERLAPAYNQF